MYCMLCNSSSIPITATQLDVFIVFIIIYIFFFFSDDLMAFHDGQLPLVLVALG